MICTRCNQDKEVSEFRHRKGRNTPVTHCRSCESDVALKNYRRSYQREYKLLKTYGLTTQDFDNLFDSQGGMCACCGRSITKDGEHSTVARVDHCHETGKIRGLLCFHCNTGIGHLGDDLNGVLNAVKYLESHG